MATATPQKIDQPELISRGDHEPLLYCLSLAMAIQMPYMSMLSSGTKSQTYHLDSSTYCAPQAFHKATMIPPFPSMTAEWHNDTYPSIDPSRPELSVKGKKIIVTGGSTGIGRETVKAFAAAGAATIAILARRQELLDETKKIVNTEFENVAITLHAVDITNLDQVRSAAKEIGGWDIMIMNAGFMPAPGRIEDADLEDWWKGFEVL